MAMNNPFLVRKPKTSTGISLRSELKRLFGSPLRAPMTLLLVIEPLLLSLAGGVDFVQGWLYSVSHKGIADKRQAAFFLDCLTGNPTAKTICAGLKAGRSKTQFWPFVPSPSSVALSEAGNDNGVFGGLAKVVSHPEPMWYGILFLVAFMAFVGIGNPNLTQIGPLLADAFGFKPKTKTRTKAKKLNDKNEGVTTDLDIPTTNKAIERFEHELLPPPCLADEKELPSNWIIGGTLLREWAADPGMFYLKQDKLTKPKNVLNERPPYFLVGDALRTNLMIVAPQGSGKTTSVFRPAINFIRRSGGVGCVWDSKGNDFNPADFTYNFDLEDFERSFRLGVFSGRTPEEAGERLAEAMIPELSEDKRYFSDIAKDALSAIVAGHYAVYERFPELTQILLYINKDSANLQELIEVIPTCVQNRDEIERLVGNLVSVQTLAEIKGDLLGNLRTALTPLTSPDISRFLAANPDPANNIFTIEELLRQPGLIRLGLPVADRPRVAPILGRLILAQFVFAVLSPRVNRNVLKLAVVDEAHNFVSLPICKGMAQARSNNAGFMLAFQTLSQIPNDSMLETIFSLAGTKLVMGGVGNKDADRFSRTFGEVWLEFVSHSSNSGRSTNSNTGGSRTSGSFMEFGASSESGSSSKSTTNYGRSNSKTAGQGENTQLHERALFSDYEIRTLPQHHAIIESANTYGQRWQAQIIDMSQATVRTLETAFTGEASRLLSEGKKKEDKDTKKKNKDNGTDENPQTGPDSGPDNDNGGWNGPRPRLGPGPGPSRPQPPTAVTVTDLALVLQGPELARIINIPTPARPAGSVVGAGAGQSTQHEQGQGHKQARVRFSVVGTAVATPSFGSPQSLPGSQDLTKVAATATATAATTGGGGGTTTSGATASEQPQTDVLEPNFTRPASQEGEVTDEERGVKFGATNVGGAHITITTTTTTLPLTDEAAPTGGNVCAPVPFPLPQVLNNDEQPEQPEPTADHDDTDPASPPADELMSQSVPAAAELVPAAADQDDTSEQARQLAQALEAYGIDPLSTGCIAQTLVQNGRDMAYLRHLAAKPDVTSLPGYLNWAISTNLNPTWPSPALSRPGSMVAATSSPTNDANATHEPGIVEQPPTMTPEQAYRQQEFERIKQGLSGAGVAQREVEKLANIALDNGRDYAYIAVLAAHPKLASLPAWLNYAITRNLPPTATGDKKPNNRR